MKKTFLLAFLILFITAFYATANPDTKVTNNKNSLIELVFYEPATQIDNVIIPSNLDYSLEQEHALVLFTNQINTETAEKDFLLSRLLFQYNDCFYTQLDIELINDKTLIFIDYHTVFWLYNNFTTMSMLSEICIPIEKTPVGDTKLLNSTKFLMTNNAINYVALINSQNIYTKIIPNKTRL